jgi:hypothetical protein
MRVLVLQKDREGLTAARARRATASASRLGCAVHRPVRPRGHRLGGGPGPRLERRRALRSVSGSGTGHRRLVTGHLAGRFQVVALTDVGRVLDGATPVEEPVRASLRTTRKCTRTAMYVLELTRGRWEDGTPALRTRRNSL